MLDSNSPKENGDGSIFWCVLKLRISRKYSLKNTKDWIKTKRKIKPSPLFSPLGRITQPEEIAHTVVYLLENDYVSGEVIDVNAGRYMD